MKVWFDADNGPHVLVMKPLAEELKRRGHDVVFSARDRAGTLELLELYGIPYQKVGGGGGKSKAMKAFATLRRASSLVAIMRKVQADVSFGHGSRALPMASKMLSIPTATMYDYEWVNASLFNKTCDTILLPDSISKERCSEAGIDSSKVVSYPGFKEQLYISEAKTDVSIGQELGYDPEAIQVLLRPPATTAHYHNVASEAVLEAVLKVLSENKAVQVIYLPRTADQRELPARAGVDRVIHPTRAYDGPSLVASVDLVIGGGGTLTREAAVLGVPSYTFFQGIKGMVDDALAKEGRLHFLNNPEDVRATLRLEKRRPELDVQSNETLVAFIVDAILGLKAKG